MHYLLLSLALGTPPDALAATPPDSFARLVVRETYPFPAAEAPPVEAWPEASAHPATALSLGQCGPAGCAPASGFQAAPAAFYGVQGGGRFVGRFREGAGRGRVLGRFRGLFGRLRGGCR